MASVHSTLRRPMAEYNTENPVSSRPEVESTLQAFATALQRLAVYPEDHVHTSNAVSSAFEGIVALLEDHDPLVIAVDGDRLLVSDRLLESSAPALAELPRRLHRRDIGSVRFERGMERDEFSVLLRAIARREERDIGVGTTPPRQVALPHAQVFPVRISTLEDRKEVAATPADTPAIAPIQHSEPREADELLWERMVTLATTSGVEGAEEEDNGAIVDRLRERLTLDGEVSACSEDVLALMVHATRSTAAVRRRVVDTVSSLSNEELARVVNGLPDSAARRSLVEHAARSLPAETTVSMARAAADAGAFVLGAASVLLLQKLADVADVPTARGRARAEAALRRHLEDLIADSREAEGPPLVRDPAPSLEPVLVDKEWAPRGAPKPGWAARLTRMGVELDVDAPAVRAAMEEVAAKEEQTLVALARSTDPASAMGARVRARAFTEDALETLLESASDENELWHVADALGPTAVPALVSAMLQDGPRTRSYRVARVLSRFGMDASREACNRLPGAPRMVQRIVLAYLRDSLQVPEDFPLTRYLRHPDESVRSAALRLQLTQQAPMETAREALLSGDPHLVRVAVRFLACSGADHETLPLLLEILRLNEQPSPIRALVVRAVQASHEPDVLEALLDVTTVRGRLLRRPRLAQLEPHVTAALHVLAREWGTDDRAREVLDLALELGALVPPSRKPSLTPRPTPVSMPVMRG
ncbi:MAG TPA: hypothetical protein VKZ41_07510 [Gemmatimonadales bacterium]|nr:hypothetical protein [Gemmatimonadales bacterium]